MAIKSALGDGLLPGAIGACDLEHVLRVASNSGQHINCNARKLLIDPLSRRSQRNVVGLKSHGTVVCAQRPRGDLPGCRHGARPCAGGNAPCPDPSGEPEARSSPAAVVRRSGRRSSSTMPAIGGFRPRRGHSSIFSWRRFAANIWPNALPEPSDSAAFRIRSALSTRMEPKIRRGLLSLPCLRDASPIRASISPAGPSTSPSAPAGPKSGRRQQSFHRPGDGGCAVPPCPDRSRS